MEASPPGDVLARALAWNEEGLGVALATVIGTWGSAPRGAGSQLVVNESGAFEGSVSGGCIESAVIEEALQILQTGGTKRLSFGVTNEMAWEVGLACGGDIEIFLERLE